METGGDCCRSFSIVYTRPRASTTNRLLVSDTVSAFCILSTLSFPSAGQTPKWMSRFLVDRVVSFRLNCKIVRVEELETLCSEDVPFQLPQRDVREGVKDFSI